MSSDFLLEIDPTRGIVTSLRRREDRFPTNYVRPDETGSLGDVIVRFRLASGESPPDESPGDGSDPWQTAATPGSAVAVEVSDGTTTVRSDAGGGPVRITQRFEPRADSVLWEIDLVNIGSAELELGDVSLPFAFNTAYAADPVTTYTERVIRHDHVAGHGSFFSFTRPNGVGPHLVLTPANDRTAPEYFQRFPDRQMFAWEGPFRVWLHSLATGSEVAGPWRLPHTSTRLRAGAAATFAFRFDWADDHDGIRDVLARNGLLDVVVAPGMVVPRDQAARVAIRSADPVLWLEAEHPDETVVTPLPRRGEYALFDIAFRRNGENAVTVHQAGRKRTLLEFFSTPPIESLIRGRAAFLARNQQYRGPLWYDGLFSNWDMRSRTMTTPDDPHGLEPHCVGGSDDPTICKAPTLAEKNVIYPDRDEIEAIEYYIDHFLVGGLQRRPDEQPRPMGIYGSDNWFQNRHADGAETFAGGWGRERMWRTFDYTHIIQLYLAMFEIASRNPALVRSHDADGYLDLAFRTAKAFYSVPYSIFMSGWDFRGYTDWAYTQGNFHEMKIPALITALECRGWDARADELRRHWETKVKYVAYDHPYPFGSEMWFDTTAFESTYAVARYALERGVEPDERGWFHKNAIAPGVGAWLSHPEVSRERFRTFLERQAAANAAARGMIAPAWYRLGSDIRQGGSSNYAISYMTPLGGAALLDYAVRYADEPATALRAGYAAQLACFALVHTGEDYPWWPAAENAGALSWAFNPSKSDVGWTHEPLGREVWPFDGENDSGLAGAIRGARTVAFEDPVLGLVGYGGGVEVGEAGLVVTPRDGVRQRVDVVLPDFRLHVSLDRDHIRSLTLEPGHAALTVVLESLDAGSHTVVVDVTGSRVGRAVVTPDTRGHPIRLELGPPPPAPDDEPVAVAPSRPSRASDFDDGGAAGWIPGSGEWAVENGWYATLGPSRRHESLLDGEHRDIELACDILIGRSGAAGLLFGMTESTGFLAQLSLPDQTVSLARRSADGSLRVLVDADFDVEFSSVYRMRVVVAGPDVEVYVDDLVRPVVRATLERPGHGAIGLRADDGVEAASGQSVPGEIRAEAGKVLAAASAASHRGPVLVLVRPGSPSGDDAEADFRRAAESAPWAFAVARDDEVRGGLREWLAWYDIPDAPIVLGFLIGYRGFVLPDADSIRRFGTDLAGRPPEIPQPGAPGTSTRFDNVTVTDLPAP